MNGSKSQKWVIEFANGKLLSAIQAQIIASSNVRQWGETAIFCRREEARTMISDMKDAGVKVDGWQVKKARLSVEVVK
jgi:hypothetical protein